MEAEIEDFNWNLRHFLTVLSTYQAKVNKANPSTLQLLEDTLDKIGNLIECIDEVSTGKNNDAIILSIDESKFEVKRSIFCRICQVDFGASRNEYLLHSAGAEHNRNLVEKSRTHIIKANPFDSNNNAQNSQQRVFHEKTDATKNEKESSQHLIDENKNVNNTEQVFIPNVFEDNIFDFIDSMGKQVTRPSQNNAMNSNRENWRERSTEGNRATSAENWRKKEMLNTSEQQPKSISDGMQIAQGRPVIPTPVTQSIIQNGAVLTGAGIKPCPTYELNNLYIKFPHLNPNKVSNPLKPTPLQDLNCSTVSNDVKKPQKMTAEILERFNKQNDERAKSVNEQNKQTSKASRLNEVKKSELTNSLLSLPTFPNANSNLEARNRMPERSASSINLVGASGAAGQRKGNQKVSQPRGHIENVRLQSNTLNGNNRPKGYDDKSKGAIPKQPIKNNSQMSNRKEVSSKTVSQSNTNTKTAIEPSVAIDSAQLKKFFSGDLSSLVNFIVEANSRPEKIVAQKKLIESIENLLKDKYRNVKCYLIGSHAYNIAKGGLATVDIYLDLYESFHTDKSGQVFVTGMNEINKLMQQSNDWSDVKCSEPTRYGILSAVYTSSNLKAIKCNFTFGTGVAVRNTEVVNSLFAAQPVVRQLVICVRLALQEGSSDEWTSYFSGYVVTLLVIFYLQIKGKLPSVLSMQSDSNIPLVKCGENLVHFKNPTNVAICKDRIRDLLIGFFSYYEKFDFSNKIISPFEGREISQSFRDSKLEPLSRSMYRFKNLIDTEPKRWTNNQMCVQDIFEHKRNVTQAIQTKQIKAFQELCSKALKVIQAVGPSVKY